MRSQHLLLAVLPLLLVGCVTAGGDRVGAGEFFGVGEGSGEQWRAGLDRPGRNTAVLALLGSAAALQINNADQHYQGELANQGYGPGGSPDTLSSVGADSLVLGSILAPFLWTPHPEAGVSGRSYAATAAYSFAATEAAVQLVKVAVGRTRPNGTSGSFYSGHTTAAFSGAQLLYRMYGPGVGVPAYTAASLVGLYRVESDNHFPSDVLVGAAMGIFISDMIYEKNHGEDGAYNKVRRFALAPYVGPEGVGLSLTWSP